MGHLLSPDEECGPGEEYKDCYRARCEKQCKTLHSPEATHCLEESGSCTPGCFCSPGLVRKGGRCVAPEMCRDCVCEGYGDPHYTTFDRRNYTFNGECSYVAARDKNPRGQHEFQVRCRRWWGEGQEDNGEVPGWCVQYIAFGVLRRFRMRRWSVNEK